ncbi:MAG: cysteine desulfurase family protein [Christensenellales bacterium]
MIYLDNAATTRPFAECNAIINDSNLYFNPAALYKPSLHVEKALQKAKKEIAGCLGVETGIFFTSGGTESNNLAIQGVFKSRRGRKCHFITSMTEHPAAYEAFKYIETQGAEVDYLPVDADGVVRVETIADALREDTALVSVMHVNNEVGAVNHINAIAQAVKRANPKILVHSDGVQAFGKIKAKLSNDIDLYSVSAHKINGHKGIGALYIRPGTKLEPLFYGGGQQGGVRPGTENAPMAVAFAKAASLHYGDDCIISSVRLCKAALEEGLRQIEGVAINSGPDSAPHILSASFAGVKGETMMHMLEEKEIYAGIGSACSSQKKDSRVLAAMGLSDERKLGTLRFSFSFENTPQEMQYVIQQVKEAYHSLCKWRRKSF